LIVGSEQIVKATFGYATFGYVFNIFARRYAGKTLNPPLHVHLEAACGGLFIHAPSVRLPEAGGPVSGSPQLRGQGIEGQQAVAQRMRGVGADPELRGVQPEDQRIAAGDAHGRLTRGLAIYHARSSGRPPQSPSDTDVKDPEVKDPLTKACLYIIQYSAKKQLRQGRELPGDSYVERDSNQYEPPEHFKFPLVNIPALAILMRTVVDSGGQYRNIHNGGAKITPRVSEKW
jgi:hypothetical protein